MVILGKKRRRKLRKPVKRVLAGLLTILFLGISIPAVKILFFRETRVLPGTSRVSNYRDLNEIHLKYARKHGITPMKSGSDPSQFEKLVSGKRLVRITETRYYVVNRLSHSHPYLVPEAARLLEVIGIRFRSKLEEKEMPPYLFRVTSLLRTRESQKRLSRSNMNASSNSAHLFGTTFDITYKSLIRKSSFGKKRVVSDPAALKLLSDVIGELQKEKKLVVVTERKEACFHITVR